MDGTDCRIFEPTPFSPCWYSHKFKGPGLRYEVGLNIRTGDIIWAHGGYPCGAWNDLKIARNVFVYFLDDGELVLADKGYRGSRYFITPNEDNGIRHKQIMARHETVNKKLKQFKILSEKYRHSLERHPMCFHAIVNITQISINYGEKLYSLF